MSRIFEAENYPYANTYNIVGISPNEATFICDRCQGLFYAYKTWTNEKLWTTWAGESTIYCDKCAQYRIWTELNSPSLIEYRFWPNLINVEDSYKSNWCETLPKQKPYDGYFLTVCDPAGLIQLPVIEMNMQYTGQTDSTGKSEYNLYYFVMPTGEFWQGWQKCPRGKALHLSPMIACPTAKLGFKIGSGFSNIRQKIRTLADKDMYARMDGYESVACYILPPARVFSKVSWPSQEAGNFEWWILRDTPPPYYPPGIQREYRGNTNEGR